jgi:pyruvate/2-oxoglutarate dehydrogenase complex dihydrolipoamide acyltransferase (E2) component
MTEKQTEALEKLNRGIKESRQEVQQRTMSLAQDYFGDSADELKQQIKESRATLEGLPDQVPGGREEVFQTMFQELMDNYSAMEECINEAREDVANLDTDQIRRQGEVEATDAARRQAREMGIDLTEVEGTGSEGRVTVDDVKKLAQTMEDGAAQQAQDTAEQVQQAAGQATDQAGQVAQGAQAAFGQAAGQVGQITDQAGGAAEEMDAPIDASDAAKREAKARGIDLSKVEGTGADGRIVYWDVVDPASEAEGGADSAGQAAQQAQDAASQAAGQAQEAAGQATDQAGQVAGQAQQAVGGLTGGGQGGGSPLGGVTDQVGQAAGQAQDTAGQATEQAQQAAGQATGGDEAEEPKATNAARRKANEMGVDLSTIEGTGSGGLITIKDVTGS